MVLGSNNNDSEHEVQEHNAEQCKCGKLEDDESLPVTAGVGKLGFNLIGRCVGYIYNIIRTF